MSETPPAIQIRGLSKQFGWRAKNRVQAVQNLSLEVASGQVYGFLGPNGAGKTTTIRMILDLIRPNQGDVLVYGKNVRKERETLQRVGSLVEGAQFYNFLTGRKNLEIFALTFNLAVDSAQIEELLEIVGLTQRSKRRVKGYSTGMKQRLGIATALLGDPDLVILDEPTNGLDPQGIREVRTLIRKLVDEHGKTVFLSSHQLSEVEQVCDRVAIINQGQVLREGSVGELVAEAGQLHIEATPLEKAQSILSERWPTSLNGSNSLIVSADREDAPIIINKLVENEVRIYEISSKRQTLEDYFISVTQGENRDAY